MALENPWSSSINAVRINDNYTMDIPAKLPLPTCVDAEKKKTKRGARRRSSKQPASEDDLPLAILAYQKGYFLDKRTSLSSPTSSSTTKTHHRRKNHISSPPTLPRKNHSPATTDKSSRKNRHSNPATTQTSKKANCQGYRHYFPVTEDDHSTLQNDYHPHHRTKMNEYYHHRHQSPRQQSIKPTCNWKLNDQTDRSSTSDTPTIQICSLPRKKDSTTTTSSDACTTTTIPEPILQPKSIATCFSCLTIHRWSIPPLNRIFLRKKNKTNMCKIDSLI